MSVEETNTSALNESLLKGVDPVPFQGDIEEEGGNRGLEQAWSTGETQPYKCRNRFWACLFLVQFLGVATLAIVWGIPALNYSYASSSDEAPSAIHFGGVICTCLLAGTGALAITSLALTVMIQWSEVLIQISIIFSMVSSVALMVACIFIGEAVGAAFAFILFCLASLYACSIWSRIPFAASNLKTAVIAVRANLGVTLVGLFLVFVAFVWTAIWLLSLTGVYVQMVPCNDEVCDSRLNGWVALLFLLSYYWTQQVIKNMIHVTVAGVVGTWWFNPDEASSMCSRSIYNSFLRSATTSFGSICLGSLLVSIIQVVHHLLLQARREGEDNILFCVLDCLVSILEKVAEFFNKWAYVYVGLYGYTFLEAGTQVMTLFRARGWTETIIHDRLLTHALFLVSVVIGVLSGCLGILIDNIYPAWLSMFEDHAYQVAFVIAFLIGTVIATILMNIVASAVDTVLVCFAESPLEGNGHHFDLVAQMKGAWKDAYPEECGF